MSVSQIEEELTRRSSILVAGHDTTAITLSWFFYNIALYPDMQEKLRSELLSLPTDDPTTEELSSLHYLDCVLREVVRLYPVLPSSLRVATEDTVLPLGEPVQINGQTQDRILYVLSSFDVEKWMLTTGRRRFRVGKGTPIVIPILAINRDKALWGEDAFEFKYVALFCVAPCSMCSDCHTLGQNDGIICPRPSRASRASGRTTSPSWAVNTRASGTSSH